MRFVFNNFLLDWDPTTEGSYKKSFVVDDKEYAINILDCSGLKEYQTVRQQHIAEAQGFILVYSITSISSFKEINDLYNTILQAKNFMNVPIVLIGNKCDLPNDERKVSTLEGQKLAKKLNCAFYEVSAKDNIHIEDTFTELVRKMEGYGSVHHVKKEKKKGLFDFFNRNKFMDDI